MLAILKIIFYIPLYNGLVLILNIPGVDAGIAVILLTCIVKIALFPLQKKALLTQIKMKEVEPELKKLKETIKDPQEQTKATMALYKKNGINPLSSFFILLIQLPILIALYRIFSSGAFQHIDATLLYSFVPSVGQVHSLFFGIVDVLKANIWLAIIAGISQFIQARFQPLPTPSTDGKPSFQNDLAKSMSVQMRYVLPLFIFFITFRLPAFIALYFITSNTFMIFQELALRPHRNKLGKK